MEDPAHSEAGLRGKVSKSRRKGRMNLTLELRYWGVAHCRLVVIQRSVRTWGVRTRRGTQIDFESVICRYWARFLVYGLRTRDQYYLHLRTHSHAVSRGNMMD